MIYVIVELWVWKPHFSAVVQITDAQESVAGDIAVHDHAVDEISSIKHTRDPKHPIQN